MDILKDYIGILTFIGVVITVYFTRKNAKSTKYIDTITSERIKWIEKIRFEVADLNSIFLTIIKNHHFIIDLEANPEGKKNIITSVDTLRQTSQLNNEISNFSKTDILRKINTIRLRLNPVEDEKILNCLNDLMTFILGQERTTANISNAWETNFTLITLTQKMLKEEWEKVKVEARS